jgi:NADH-ubiquinone oxidoreductase chain 2
MVLSAALDKGYIFLSFVAIFTSVIGAVYYLSIIKEIFFYSPSYKVNPLLKDLNLHGNIYNTNTKEIVKSLSFNYKNIAMSSPMAITIAIITLIIILFIFMNKE